MFPPYTKVAESLNYYMMAIQIFIYIIPGQNTKISANTCWGWRQHICCTHFMVNIIIC